MFSPPPRPPSGSGRYLARDITDTARCAAVIDACEALAQGPISILVNNAGIHLKKPAAETTDAEFLRGFSDPCRRCLRLEPGMRPAT